MSFSAVELAAAAASLCGNILASLVFGVARLAVFVASYFMNFEMVGFVFRRKGDKKTHMLKKEGDTITYTVTANNSRKQIADLTEKLSTDKEQIADLTEKLSPDKEVNRQTAPQKSSPALPTKCQKCGSLDITKRGSTFFTDQGTCKRCGHVMWKHRK